MKPAQLKNALEKKKTLLGKAQGVYTAVVSSGEQPGPGGLPVGRPFLNRISPDGRDADNDYNTPPWIDRSGQDLELDFRQLLSVQRKIPRFTGLFGSLPEPFSGLLFYILACVHFHSCFNTGLSD